MAMASSIFYTKAGGQDSTAGIKNYPLPCLPLLLPVRAGLSPYKSIEKPLLNVLSSEMLLTKMGKPTIHSKKAVFSP